MSKSKHPLKGNLIPCSSHEFEWLNQEQRDEAIKVNKFRDKHLALVRCRKCGGYQFTM